VGGQPCVEILKRRGRWWAAGLAGEDRAAVDRARGQRAASWSMSARLLSGIGC